MLCIYTCMCVCVYICVCIYVCICREAPIAIFLDDSVFRFFGSVPIPIFADSDFLSKNYN